MNEVRSLACLLTHIHTLARFCVLSLSLSLPLIYTIFFLYFCRSLSLSRTALSTSLLLYTSGVLLLLSAHIHTYKSARERIHTHLIRRGLSNCRFFCYLSLSLSQFADEHIYHILPMLSNHYTYLRTPDHVHSIHFNVTNCVLSVWLNWMLKLSHFFSASVCFHIMCIYPLFLIYRFSIVQVHMHSIFHILPLDIQFCRCVFICHWSCHHCIQLLHISNQMIKCTNV